MQEQDRVAAAARPAGATDAMDVAFAVEWEVVVDDVADPLHVQAAGGHIGGDDHVELARAQFSTMRSRWFCGNVTAQGRGPVPLAGKIVGERLGRALGIDENQHAIDRFGLQDAGQHGLLLMRADDHETLPHRFGGGAFCWIVISAGFRRCRWAMRRIESGNGGREQRDLTLGRGLRENPFDVFGKAHPQHFIGFVQHQPAQAVELERAAANVVHDPARRAHDDVDSAIELAELDLVILAAVDRHDPQSRQSGGIAPEGVGNLDRQFARRRQNEDLRPFCARSIRLKHRYGKSGGLAGAGLRLAKHIPALEQQRDRRA